jgi:hypothetical protein
MRASSVTRTRAAGKDMSKRSAISSGVSGILIGQICGREEGASETFCFALFLLYLLDEPLLQGAGFAAMPNATVLEPNVPYLMSNRESSAATITFCGEHAVSSAESAFPKMENFVKRVEKRFSVGHLCVRHTLVILDQSVVF